MRAVTEFAKRDAIAEGSDSQYSCVFVESAVGAPQLNAAAITAIVATLADRATNQVINSRTNQNVLNANGGTLGGDGTFTLQLGALDNSIVTAGSSLEEHRLTLEVTFNRTGGGVGTLTHEARYWVRNLADV